MKSKFRKVFSLILTVLILLSAVTVTAVAATVEEGKCGENLTWTLDDNGTLTISGTGEMYDWTSGTSPWYDIRDTITKVKIQSGVTSIGDFAFGNCKFLTIIEMPVSVTSIGIYALNFTPITYPDVYYNGNAEQLSDILISIINGNKGQEIIGGVNVLVNTLDKFHLNSCFANSDYQHIYSSEITTSATHLTEGILTFTCECGDTYTEAIRKTEDHTYTAVITAPTCTDKGYTTHTCACGNSYTSDYVKENGHSYTSKITTPATYLEEGVMTCSCACGHMFTVTVEKLVATFKDSEKAVANGNNISMMNNVTAASLLSQASAGSVVLDKNGNSISSDVLVGTGMVFVLPDGTKKEIVVFGDVDGNGKLTASDARLALRASVQLENYAEGSCYYLASDIERTNSKITASDARLILRASVELENPKNWMI